jgi:hypothetical protein
MDEKVLTKMREEAPLNMEKAEKIANEFGLKTKSVIASATRNGIEYERKARVGKTGEPAVRKEELVTRIADKFGLEVTELDGLEKANKRALEALLK